MPALTRLQLQNRVGDLINDPNNTEWSAAKVQAKLQEGQEQFVIDTRSFIKISNSSIVAGTATYSLPSGIVTPVRVTANGLEIEKSSKNDLDRIYGIDWTTLNGTPEYYVLETDVDSLKIRLVPNPQSADAGTNNLKIEHTILPDEMSGDSSYPFTNSSVVNTLFNPYHMAVAYWAASDLMRVNPTNERIAMSREYERQYKKMVDDCVGYLEAMTRRTPLVMRGGRYHRGL